MRVPRTFAFLDLSGFTNYTAAYGDDAAGRILGTFRTLVREVASQRGVRIAKWLGDGCMVVAVEQQAAIEFVTDLERRASRVCAPLMLRAGLASGPALLFEGDDYIGSAVNLAEVVDLGTLVEVVNLQVFVVKHERGQVESDTARGQQALVADFVGLDLFGFELRRDDTVCRCERILVAFTEPLEDRVPGHGNGPNERYRSMLSWKNRIRRSCAGM